MQAAASYLASLPKGPVDERFKETPRAFPVKSNRRATFDTVPGSMSGFGSTRLAQVDQLPEDQAVQEVNFRQVVPMPVQKDPAKEAAKKDLMNLRRLMKLH